MNERLKTLIRLMRYLLDRTRNAPFRDPTARKCRKAFHLTVQLLHKLLTGKVAPADLESLMRLLDKSGLGDKIRRTLDLDGGPGSGNFGHKGRPGEVGGSAPKGNISHGGNNSMTDNEIGSLKRYKSSESYKINAKLRLHGYDNLAKVDKDFVDSLDSALKKLPRYKGNVYRTLLIDDPEELETFVVSHGVGEKVTYGAYSSFSKTPDYNDKANVRIYVRNSQKGRDMDIVDNGKNEVLYERNSVFVVSDVVKRGETWHILEVES